MRKTIAAIGIGLAKTANALAVSPELQLVHTAMVWSMNPFCTYSASDDDLVRYKVTLEAAAGWSQAEIDVRWSKETHKVLSASSGNVAPCCRRVGQIMRQYYGNDFDSRMLDQQNRCICQRECVYRTFLSSTP